jgi:hypothetical protein
MMSGNKDKDRDRPDMANLEEVGARPGSGAGSQQGGSGGHQASSGINSNFAHASPDSMVNPPGAPQSGAGSVAGKDDVPAGVSSQIQASRNAQSGMGAAAGGDDGRGVVHSSGGAGMDRDS